MAHIRQPLMLRPARPIGDVLIAAGNQLVRSGDHGQTWNVPEQLPDNLGTITDYGSGMFASGNQLFVMRYRTQESIGKRAQEILMADSPFGDGEARHSLRIANTPIQHSIVIPGCGAG